MSKKFDQVPSTEEALNRLDVFAGTWKTEGEVITSNSDPNISFKGTDTYKWLPGDRFMIHYVDILMGEQQIYSTEIIGYDPESGTYPMHYFDHEGNTGIMKASVDKSTWIFREDDKRFTGSFNSSGNVMSGKWERLAGSDWVHWMDIKLTKV